MRGGFRHSYANKKGEVVSEWEGKRIATGRRKSRGLWGDLDPENKRLFDLIEGKLTVEDLDDEELSAGITRCNDGKFSDKAAWMAAVVVPEKIQKAIQKELYRRADNMLSGSLLGAVKSITAIATSPNAEDKDRFKAAVYVLERLKGKTPDVIVHSQDKPWEVVLDGVETTTRAAARARRAELENAVDAELVGEPVYAELVDNYEEDPDE